MRVYGLLPAMEPLILRKNCRGSRGIFLGNRKKNSPHPLFQDRGLCCRKPTHFLLQYPRRWSSINFPQPTPFLHPQEDTLSGIYPHTTSETAPFRTPTAAFRRRQDMRFRTRRDSHSSRRRAEKWESKCRAPRATGTILPYERNPPNLTRQVS